jgi:alpha-1,3-fucosyltransferase
MPLPAPIGSSQLDRYIKYFGQKAAKAAPGNGNMAEGKVGLAVQFVSNCRTYSRLEAYVRELRRYVPVDIYGKCGEFKCSGDKSDVKESNGITRGDKSSSVKTIISNSNKQGAWDCHQQVATKYKFFLAFEDSFCKDFVTEKFFSMFNGDLDMVPVVLGGGNYSAIAPPNSYIDASKFQSPKALAHHLKV